MSTCPMPHQSRGSRPVVTCSIPPLRKRGRARVGHRPRGPSLQRACRAQRNMRTESLRSAASANVGPTRGIYVTHVTQTAKGVAKGDRDGMDVEAWKCTRTYLKDAAMLLLGAETRKRCRRVHCLTTWLPHTQRERDVDEQRNRE